MAENVSDAAPTSAVALISYALMGTWNLTVGGIFGLLIMKVTVESVMVGILGAIISAETAALAAVTGFWLANSLNSNRSSANKDAVIAAALPSPSTPLNANAKP